MDIYVYSDESGVFDVCHNSAFVFGGAVFLSKSSKEKAERMYSSVENEIKKRRNIPLKDELKASRASNADKYSLYRSMNSCYKFGVVINEQRVNSNIYCDKKTKQRSLDYAYKIGIKKMLCKLIDKNIIQPMNISKISFFVDEHTTATNGLYELKEALLNEFKKGTFNLNWDEYFPPIFPSLKDLDLQYCDSESKTLIRSADIIANHIYHNAINGVECDE